MSAEQYPKAYLYKRVVQAKLFIDANFSDSLDIDNIADESSFSKFHFIRLFKKIYGRTPHQYLIYVRIEKAMLLLQSGDTVSEVCAAVGFESLSSFSVLFKRLKGITPSAFVSGQAQKRAEISEEPLRFIPGCIAHQSGWMKK